MAYTAIFTNSDVIDELCDFQGCSTTDAATLRKIKRSIENAYREVANCRDWSYFLTRGRLNTVASYNTGTIAYTHSSRQVALTSGTWPSWAAFGLIQIAGVEYRVVTRTSDSVLVLSVNHNPGADVDAGTTYDLYRDTYPLPVNWQSIGTVRDANNDYELTRMAPNEYVACRTVYVAPSQPTAFAIMGDPSYVGTMCLRLYPPPDAIYQYDYMFKRYPRQFTTWQYDTGTVTTSGTSVTGTSTAWNSAMVGCVIRFASTGTDIPTGTHGARPYYQSRIIAGFSSTTGLTLDQALDAEVTGVGYEISDPIEIEAPSMYTAFLRRCEYELGIAMRRDDVPKLSQAYQEALTRAFEADHRTIQAGMEPYHQRVPTYFPITNAVN